MDHKTTSDKRAGEIEANVSWSFFSIQISANYYSTLLHICDRYVTRNSCIEELQFRELFGRNNSEAGMWRYEIFRKETVVKHFGVRLKKSFATRYTATYGRL